MTASFVEAKYQERIGELTPKQRVARTASMFEWAREAIARQIVADMGTISAERLKWLVAHRQYRASSEIRKMIERKLQSVSS
jgi:hypothetical protein